jgi:hypothetical protein
VSQPKPTPGPWKATDSYALHSEQPWLIWSVPRDRALAQCYRISEAGEQAADEQAANAHLLASAPDLLAALEAIEARLDRWAKQGIARGPHGADTDWLTLLTQIHDAIRKANGGRQ